MPNVHYLPGRYWDYFDHHTPLSHLSLAEGMALAGLDVTRVIPRFLPYTVKSAKAMRSIALLRVYLRLPWAWPLIGRQMLVVAQKPASDAGGKAGGGSTRLARLAPELSGNPARRPPA